MGPCAWAGPSASREGASVATQRDQRRQRASSWTKLGRSLETIACAAAPSLVPSRSGDDAPARSSTTVDAAHICRMWRGRAARAPRVQHIHDLCTRELSIISIWVLNFPAALLLHALSTWHITRSHVSRDTTLREQQARIASRIAIGRTHTRLCLSSRALPRVDTTSCQECPACQATQGPSATPQHTAWRGRES